jgi:hypothetical protein
MEKWLSLPSVAGPEGGVPDCLPGSRNDGLSLMLGAAQGVRLQCRFTLKMMPAPQFRKSVVFAETLLR